MNTKNTSLMTGHAPLHVAVSAGNIKVVQLLLDEGVNPNQKNDHDDTPLHVAVSFHETDMIPILIRAGADPNIPGRYGHTLLYQIISRPDRHDAVHLLKMLLRHGANPDQVCDGENTPLTYLVRHCVKSDTTDARYRDYIRLFDILVRHAHPDRRNVHGQVPLLYLRPMGTGYSEHLYDGHRHVYILKSLLDAGANPNIRHIHDDTLLSSFIYSTRERLGYFDECINMLLAAGAKVTDANVVYAVHLGDLSLVKRLVQHGGSVNAREAGSMFTALHIAVIQGHPDIARFLLVEGADATRRNWNGKMARHHFDPDNYRNNNDNRNAMKHALNETQDIVHHGRRVTHAMTRSGVIDPRMSQLMRSSIIPGGIDPVQKTIKKQRRR